MSKEKFSLSTLKMIEHCNVSFDRLLKEAVLDCHSRPKITARRKIVMTMELEPVLDGFDLESCASVNGRLRMDVKIPTIETQFINFDVSKNGDITFNPDSLENAAQMTMLDDDNPPAGSGKDELDAGIERAKQAARNYIKKKKR